jgi:D-amino-acid dehydrogenase
MMPNMMPRVGRGRHANVFYNTGHGHLGWTLSAVTAEMVSGVIDAANQSVSNGKTARSPTPAIA